MAKKQMDKLSQEVHQALAAGMSYGKWKAMQTPVKIEPKPDLIKYETKICAYCGAEYYVEDNRPRKYCGTRCKKLAGAEIASKHRWRKRNGEE
jgi:hypothetical protein